MKNFIIASCFLVASVCFTANANACGPVRTVLSVPVGVVGAVVSARPVQRVRGVVLSTVSKTRGFVSSRPVRSGLFRVRSNMAYRAACRSCR